MDYVFTYPQLIHSLLTVAALLFSLVAIWHSVLTRRLILQEFPGRTTINTMRGEVAEFSGQLADLSDRFARFQKREGMRTAREEKEVQKSLKEQAAAILAGATGPQQPEDVKDALRRRIRGLQ